jgi:hypothetical protein
VCINKLATPISYNTTIATGAAVTGLPTGMSGAWLSNVFTISGTPTVAGTYSYTVTTSGGCVPATITGTIYVQPNNTITLTSAAGTDSQTVCINTAITSITYSTTGATNATVTPLPTGVTGLWSSNGIVISGTPTTSGTFNYTITLTGGCGIITKTGRIVVTPNNTITLTSAVGTDAQTICTNSSIATITYATTGATDATITGLPAGVTGGWAGNVVTIGGKPSVAGTFPYTITLTGGCGVITKNGTITVTPLNTIVLSSAAGTDSQTVCVSTAITDITYSTTGATNASVVGLPPGVTGSWLANVYTIRGTPTTAGNYTYTVTTIGGCGVATATGTIVVNPNNTITLSSAAGTDSQTVCINTAITSITYTTTGATGATFASLPTGVTGSWAGNVVTIIGTPTVAGLYNYTITLTGGCGIITKSGKILVRPDDAITLSSAAGTDSQTVCINTAATQIRYTTATASNATVTGLPTGMSGAWLSNVFTISGTPTVAGTYSYTVTTSGGCVPATITGTIYVQPNNTITLTSAAGTDSQTVCINTAITSITYSTTGATNATVTPLPTGVTGSWSNNGFVISGTPTVAGTYNYVVTLSGGCGVVTATGKIVVTPNDTIVLGSAAGTNSQTVCINTGLTTIRYTTTIATDATVLGLPTGVTGTWAGNVFTITGTPTVAGTYTYTITTSGGCVPATATGTILVKPDNTITLTSAAGTDSQTLCINTVLPVNIQYTTTIATGATPTGLPPGVTGIWVNNVYTISGTPTVAGTYNYTVTTTGGCAPATISGTILVHPNNTIVLSSAAGTDSQTVCINTAINSVTFTTTRATGATFTGLPTGVNGGWLNNVVTISGTPTAAGVYNYTITLTGGCGIITRSGKLQVDAATIAGSISSTSVLICNGFAPPTINLTGNLSTKIEWISGTTSGSLSPTIPPQSGNSISSVINNSAPGSSQVTHYYQAKVTNGVCATLLTNEVAITVDPSSQVGLINPAQKVQQICIGSPRTSLLNVVLPSHVGTIQWQTAAPAGIYSDMTGLTNTILPNTSLQTETAKTMLYRAKITSGVCPAIFSEIASVQVDALSVAGSLYYQDGNSPICNQGIKPTMAIDPASLSVGGITKWLISAAPSSTVSVGSAAISLTYIDAAQPGNFLNSSIDNTAPILNSSFRYYRVVVQNGVCPADTSAPKELEVKPTPLIDSVKSNERCGPGTVNLLAYSNLGTVEWYGATTGGTLLSTGNAFTTPNLTSKFNYFYAGARYNGCASLARTMVIAEVIPIPIVAAIPDSTYCGPHVFNICVSATDGGTVNWYTNPTGGTSIKTGDCYTTPLLRSNTTYYADAALRGCTTVTRTPINAIIFEVPKVDSIPNFNLCAGNTINVSPYTSLGVPPYTYAFTSNNGSVVGLNMGMIKGIKGGTSNVFFNIKDQNNCVSPNSNTFSIKTYDPVLPLKFNYQAYYKDDFVIPTKKDSGYILYNWNPGFYLNYTDRPEPIFNGEYTTDYVLVRTDTTSKCTVADNYHIDVTKDFILEVPNAFTPNGDGLNDIIRVIANAGIEYVDNFRIFNREGLQVFPLNPSMGWDSRNAAPKMLNGVLVVPPDYEHFPERVTPANPFQPNGNRGFDTWDGRDAQGKVLETDGYFWKANIHFKDNTSKPKSGMFLLLK